ncbi:permease [Salinispira pacifica]|uniref:Transporter n=1 Tax=Salinispira pacifica TaxID=1307761 RepID=V5WD24_9SPIO|nr:permease [Salinispira pacifica]AHC13692.1 Transporter [Salinispira pacifica]
MEYVYEIARFMGGAFVKIWPLLAITIPFAAAMRISGNHAKVTRFLSARPAPAILLAMLIGAVSPLCSCSVIPVIAGMMAAGVPLGPIMTFWIASPSMDPEIFFLSVSTLGMNLAVWRIIATAVLSLAGGILAHFMQSRGWVGQSILKDGYTTRVFRLLPWLRERVSLAWTRLVESRRPNGYAAETSVSPEVRISSIEGAPREFSLSASLSPTAVPGGDSCCTPGSRVSSAASCCSGEKPEKTCECSGDATEAAHDGQSRKGSTKPLLRRFFREMGRSGVMVLQFIALAFFLEALIVLYVPLEWITGIFGQSDAANIFMATLVSIPLYTTNLSALGLMGGLLQQGLAPAAVLAFLIGGATTTLPAMAAVYGLTHRRVFALYVSISIIGSLMFGLLYSIF